MKLFYLCGLLLLSSCMSNKPTPEYITLLHKTTAQFNKELSQEHQLLCRGYGGRLMNDISGVTQHYLAVKKCDVPTARRLVVSSIEKLAAMINANPQLHPFLNQYPFPADRIHVSIAFVNEKSHAYTDGSVTYVTARDNKIFYAKYDPIKGRLEDLWKEDYAEAYRIVNFATYSLPTTELQTTSCSPSKAEENSHSGAPKFLVNPASSGKKFQESDCVDYEIKKDFGL